MSPGVELVSDLIDRDERLFAEELFDLIEKGLVFVEETDEGLRFGVPSLRDAA